MFGEWYETRGPDGARAWARRFAPEAGPCTRPECVSGCDLRRNCEDGVEVYRDPHRFWRVLWFVWTRAGAAVAEGEAVTLEAGKRAADAAVTASR